MTSHFNWRWPAVITLSAAVAGLFVINDMASPLRAFVTLWFMAVCPGMAYVRLLQLRNPYYELILAVALSLALTLIVATFTVYAGIWSAAIVLQILVVLSSIGVLWQLYLWYGELARQAGQSS